MLEMDTIPPVNELPNASRILKDLFQNYDKRLRPGHGGTTSFAINFVIWVWEQRNRSRNAFHHPFHRRHRCSKRPCNLKRARDFFTVEYSVVIMMKLCVRSFS